MSTSLNIVLLALKIVGAIVSSLRGKIQLFFGPQRLYAKTIHDFPSVTSQILQFLYLAAGCLKLSYRKLQKAFKSSLAFANTKNKGRRKQELEIAS